MKNKKELFILADIILVGLAFICSFLLRFESKIPDHEFQLMVKNLPYIIIIRMLCFIFCGLYKEINKYLGFRAILNILKSVAIGSLAFILFVLFVHHTKGFPRSIYFIDTILAFTFLSGFRFFKRIIQEGINVHIKKFDKRILIVGAGDAGHRISNEIHREQINKSIVLAFVDDDPLKHNLKINGVPVLGNTKSIENIVSNKNINEIIIAIANISDIDLKNIVNECEKTKANIKTIPPLTQLIDGNIHLNQVKNINIEDLLGRDAFSIHPNIINNYLAGKRILITGAGGSIGSEICRQLLKFKIASITLFGRGEHSIYSIHNELQEKDIKIDRILGDIINKKKLEIIFKKFKPDIVFHAAADKHVELMELNPDEAVLNNIIGTKNVIDTCEKFKIEKLICISTDKAANPQNIMGYSKRIAEIYIQNKKTKNTKVMAVRFGNVLGSRGSVIPLFKKQIEKKGPITITHPEVNRYFMTISEAAQLVIEVGGIGNNGEIFLLDMGKPVKIVDLAKDMIKLAGLKVNKDIKIKFIGLKPGEKITEVLTNENEILEPTINSKIFKVKTKKKIPSYKKYDMEKLKNLAIDLENEELVKKIKKMVGD